MDAPTQRALIGRLLEMQERGESEIGARESTLSADRYLDPQRALREQRQVFARSPLVLAHASTLAPGSCRPYDLAGVPVLAVRDSAGTFRAFLNVCRHRGTRLLSQPAECSTLVCPYHGWSYGLSGQLLGVPDQRLAFPELDRARHGLVPLPCREEGELLWVGLTPGEGPLELGSAGRWTGEFGGLLAGHRVFREVRTEKACNWKLVMDAFLEGYHVRYLHKDTLARFFRGLVHAADTEGTAWRIVSSRTDTAEARSLDPSQWSLRRYATVYWFLFPNTVLLFHPDNVSLLQTWPVPGQPSRCIWHHQLLVPASKTEEEPFERSWQLLEETVFSREDLAVCESIQTSLDCGALDRLLLGRLEHMVGRFHAELDRQLE